MLRRVFQCLFVLSLSSPALAELSSYEAKERLQSILQSPALSDQQKFQSVSAFESEKDKEVQALACVASSLLGKNKSTKALELLTHENYRIANLAVECLLLSRHKDAAAKIIPLTKNNEELIRGHAGIALAQLENESDAAQAIDDILRTEKQKHIPFNILSQLKGWNTPVILNAVMREATQSLANDTSFNKEGVGATLLHVADKNPRAFKVLESMLQHRDDVLYKLPKPGLERVSKKFGRSILNELQKLKIVDYKHARSINELFYYRPSGFENYLEKTIERCDGLACDKIVEVAAALFNGTGLRILNKAAKSKDRELANRARAMLDYVNSRRRRERALSLIDIRVKDRGKLLYDSHSLRNGLLLLASRDPQGFRREDLEQIFVELDSKMDLDSAEMMYAYLLRFGKNSKALFELRQKLPIHSVTGDILNTYLVANPTPEGCLALRNLAARDLGSEKVWSFIRLRQRGSCS